MKNHTEEPTKFHTVQAERDLEANWEVDLSKKLEEYLLKICSGEITSADDDINNSPVNFAEAALLLQGSIQVYSRKVEYLYGLVLHALEFLSQKRQQEQSEGTSAQPEQSGRKAVLDEDNDHFWGLDDVAVEARNCLDASTSKDASFYHFVKPPANLVVLEGDCLDTTGDVGELESYLLAANDLYQDFILLDPCDAAAVNEFLKGNETQKGQNSTYRGSLTCKAYQSPTRCSGGSARKSSQRKKRDADINQSPAANCCFGFNQHDFQPDPSAYDNHEDIHHGFDRYSEPGNHEDSDNDDDDDPWKPLNPHEPGNLKVKPFKKVKAFRRNVLHSSKISVSTVFPLARMHGPISPELKEMWETRCNRTGRDGKTQSSLYEKLRQSLVNGGPNASDTLGTAGNDAEDDGYDGGMPDFGQPDEEMPETMFMGEDLPFHHEKATDIGVDNTVGPSSQANLEDLCRSHLDALLANIAETEKQTELATRVSSWKQKIEDNLEEQDSRPPFDIHFYGDSIIGKLSVEADSENATSFTDIVKGQEKHDVARAFSALLQLVNNGDVDLDRSGVNNGSVCYTAVNPFHVRLLRNNKRRETQFRLPKKRVKLPMTKGCNKVDKDKFGLGSSPQNGSAEPNCKFPVKLGKIGGARCTPEGKRRRRSRFAEPVDLGSTG